MANGGSALNRYYLQRTFDRDLWYVRAESLLVFAEEVGVDAFGVGEHHCRDFSISSPEVVLAAIAGRTARLVRPSKQPSA